MPTEESAAQAPPQAAPARQRSLWWKRGAFFGGGFLFMVGVHALAVAPVIGSKMPLVIGSMVVGCGFPFAIVFVLIAWAWRGSLGRAEFSRESWMLFGCLVIGIACSGNAATRVRLYAFDRAGDRLDPVIQGIRAYERDHGLPPPSVESLVPAYLSHIPDTGMPAYPHLLYSVGPDGWALSVPAFSGLMQFDLFQFRSDEDRWIYHWD